MRGRKGVGKDGRERWEELQGIWEGETAMRIYCVRKESIFNKRKKVILTFLLSDLNTNTA